MSAVLEKRRGNPNWGHCKSYSEVRDAIKAHHFKTMAEYKEWVIENKPEGFPLTPYATYTRRNEWVSTRHFLGKLDIVPEEDKGIIKRFNYFSIRNIIKQLMGRG